MKKKTLLFGSLATTFAIGIGIVAASGIRQLNKVGLFVPVGGSTTYYHYEAVASTCEKYGIKEYWTDCKGYTTIEEPVGAVITEKGLPSDADIQYIVDTYGADDERIIAKAEHNFVNSVVAEKIGYFATVCSVCGEAGAQSSDKMQFADIDFTKATYGAEGGKWGTNVQPTAKTMTYEVTAGHTENEIKLPKINFNLYKSVSFTLTGNVWDARVGLESGSYAFPYSASGVHTGTLTFTVGQTSVAAALECSDGVNQNLTITDADILSGSKSVSLYMIADDAYRAITIELTGLTEPVDGCTHDFVVDSNCIGKEVCSICGEARGVANPSFDFTANLYGAYDTYEPWGITTPQNGWVRADSASQIAFVNYTAGDTCVYYLPKMYFAGFSSVSIDIAVNYSDVVYSLDNGFATSYTTPFAGYSLKLVFDNITASSMTVKILDAFSTVQVQATCTDANVLNGLANFNVFVKGSGNVGWDALSNFTFTA